MTENIFALQLQHFAFKHRFGKGGVGEGIDQANQLVVIQLVLADTVENTFKLGVAVFDCL